MSQYRGDYGSRIMSGEIPQESVMAKFIFLQPYTIRIGNISVGQGGATGGTIVKSFNTGDIIEGVRKLRHAGLPNRPHEVTIETVVDGKSHSIAGFLVKGYTGTESVTDAKTEIVTDANKKQSASMFTPKNIVIGVLVAVGIYGLLKFTKIIK